MTTNGQLNDACVYQIIPTNFTCSTVSSFRLKGQCTSVRGQKHFCQRSQILIIVEKCYRWQYLDKYKNKKCLPKSVYDKPCILHYEELKLQEIWTNG